MKKLLPFIIIFLLGVAVGTWFVAPLLKHDSTATTIAQPTQIIIGEASPVATAVQSTSSPTTPALPTTTAPKIIASPSPIPTIADTISIMPTAVVQIDEMLRLVNNERASVGCAPVQRESKIQQAAQLHAEDMAKHEKIDHVGSDGATYQERLDRVGYQYVRRGENIAAGFATPAEVVAIWMDEPTDGPHRANISNCTYKHAGTGLAFRADGYPYWVLDLAEPKGE